MLVDEDERLYDAFQALDHNGDGLISKQELGAALLEHERKVKGKGNGHHQRESTTVLFDTLRVQSAFGITLDTLRVPLCVPLFALCLYSRSGAADKNDDGQIDVEYPSSNPVHVISDSVTPYFLYVLQYEELLRMLHPEFHDDDMTMDNFKHNIIRLQVQMQNVAVVHMVQSLQNLLQNTHRLLLRKRLFLTNPTKQLSAGKELHDQMQLVPVLVDIEQLDDVGMVHFT